MPEHIKKKLEEQIRELEHELTHDLPIEIKKAASLGDLSENAEYHMAKQRQVFVNARLGQLKKRMAELALVNLSNIPHDRIAFGSTVVVFDTTKNEEITYKLVTSEESDVTWASSRPPRRSAGDWWASKSATWPRFSPRMAGASWRS